MIFDAPFAYDMVLRNLAFSQQRDNAAKSRIITVKNRDSERFGSDNLLSDAVML